jgi:hypothetical protein
MMLRRISLFALLTTAGLALAAPGPAAGATVVGRANTPTTGGECLGGFTRLQITTALYTVPLPGVLTTWSFAAAASPPQLRLKVGRPTGGTNFTIVGESPVETMTANTLRTFPIRIPVQAGDVLGEYQATDGHCSSGSAGYSYVYVNVDQPLGTNATFLGPVTNTELPLAASLEADSDRDGFGDETQDQCPTNATTQGPCPTGQRAAALRRCKKKAHKKHWSKKRLKKCKKKARLLPV